MMDYSSEAGSLFAFFVFLWFLRRNRWAQPTLPFFHSAVRRAVFRSRSTVFRLLSSVPGDGGRIGGGGLDGVRRRR